MTQQALAEAIGVSPITIFRWEQGCREPKAGDIEKLAGVLGTSEHAFFSGPLLDTWAFQVVCRRETEGGVMDLTGNASNAELVVGERGMGVTLYAPYEMWEDEGKFEALMADLRRKREMGMKARKEGWSA